MRKQLLEISRKWQKNLELQLHLLLQIVWKGFCKCSKITPCWEFPLFNHYKIPWYCQDFQENFRCTIFKWPPFTLYQTPKILACWYGAQETSQKVRYSGGTLSFSRILCICSGILIKSQNFMISLWLEIKIMKIYKSLWLNTDACSSLLVVWLCHHTHLKLCKVHLTLCINTKTRTATNHYFRCKI